MAGKFCRWDVCLGVERKLLENIHSPTSPGPLLLATAKGKTVKDKTKPKMYWVSKWVVPPSLSNIFSLKYIKL